MRHILFLLAALLVGVTPQAGHAQGADPFAGLSSSSYDAIREAVTEIAASGNARALPVLEALRDGKLYARRYAQGDHALYIKRNTGSFVDARTGTPQPNVTASGLREIRMSNPVRGALDTALGRLQLFASDPVQRAQAAEAVFQSHDTAALASLDRAIAREHDPAALQAMRQARAAALLFGTAASEADRLEAVAVLRARGDLTARSLLDALPPQSANVAQTVRDARLSIDRRLQLWSVLQSIFYGLSLGSVLLLAAIGLAITFGVMGVINMAHGEMVMIGAYITFLVQQVIRAHAPVLSGASLIIAIPLVFLAAGAIGVAIERGLIRFLYGRPLETLLATWGLSLILQQAVRTVFGPTNRAISAPAWMSGEAHLGGLAITYNRMYIIVFAALVLLALMAVLRYTPLGLQMRAVTQNRRMAASMGIRTPWVDALTFGLGSGVAGIAGVALSQIDNVSPNLGQSYIIDSFMVVVFGGVGNLWGTLVSALTLGIVNKFLEPVAGAVLGKIVVLVLLILFIQRRPRGMFPLKGRAVEA